jgi:hypothetical protein
MVELIIERKIITWLRTTVQVHTGNVENAIAQYNDPQMPGCDFIKSEEVPGSRRPVAINENNLEATVRIFIPEDRTELWNNLSHNK